MSPAIERLTGRNAASQKLCTVINWVPISRQRPESRTAAAAPWSRSAITRDDDPSKPATTALAPTARTTTLGHAVGRVQCAPSIDLATFCPPLHKVYSSQARKNHHVLVHQCGNKGDSRSLYVVIGLLERDNDNREQQVHLQQEQDSPIAQTAQEYLAPYRSHAHCQTPVHVGRLGSGGPLRCGNADH